MSERRRSAGPGRAAGGRIGRAEREGRRSRPRLEFLEDRLTPATFAVSGGALYLGLATGERLSVVSHDKSYSLGLDADHAWSGIDGPEAIGAGQATLTVTAAGLAAFTSGVHITDGASAGGDSVTFLDGGSAAYSNSFVIALDHSASGAATPGLSFEGTTNFKGSAGLTAAAAGDVVVAAAASLKLDGGALSLSATGANAPLTVGGRVVDAGGPVTLRAAGSVDVAADALVNAGEGELELAADVRGDGAGDDGVGTLSVAAAARVYAAGITLRGADVAIDAAAEVGRATSGPAVSTFVPSSAGLLAPVGAAFDAAGDLYVANYSGHSISKVTPSGVVTTFASGPELSSPTSLAFDVSGNLYVANYDQRTISKVAPDGTVRSFVTSGLSGPFGLAFGPNGDLYVANENSSTILKVTPAGVVSTFVDLGSTVRPFGLAFGPDGDLYTSSRWSRSISKVTPGGVVSTVASSGLSSPWGLAFDSSGRLYVADQGAGSVLEVADGGFVMAYASGLPGATCLAVGPNGDLFITSLSQSIVSKATLSAPATARVTIRSSLGDRPMSLGGLDDAVAGINLTDAELARIFTANAGVVTVGDASQVGDITFTSATLATTPGAATAVVQSADGAGRIILAGGAGTALNGNGGLVSFAPGKGGLAAEATDLGTPLMTHGFTANGLTLNLTLGFDPSPGESIFLVRNTGPAIVGEFANLPDGGVITLTSEDYGSHQFQVRYFDRSLTLWALAAPAITSADHQAWAVGAPGDFTITTTGYPGRSLSMTGALPSGVSFIDNDDGTATLSGTPAAGAGGAYHISIIASNGVAPDAVQKFTLTVDQAPAFTSADHATFVAGRAGSFTIATAGFPAAAIQPGSLPIGLSFVDNGDGTATLSGTPEAGPGVYSLTYTAANGVEPDASQKFILTVVQASAFTSADHATFVAGRAGSFVVTTSGSPTAAVTLSGALPAGLAFVLNDDGTAALSGTPAAGTAGVYPLIFTAANGVEPDASQKFILTVVQASSFTSADHATFVAGRAGSFVVTTAGFPAAAIQPGSLPIGLSFVDNGDGTATLSGTPEAGPGVYSLTYTAANGVEPDASQKFTLTVVQASAFTSADHATFVAGRAGSFTIATAGFPAAAISAAGGLPVGLSFVDNGDGTATLSGTPEAGSGGDYRLGLAASNGVEPDASQKFILTIDQAVSSTTITLASSRDASMYGQGVLLTATVQAAAGSVAPLVGMVQFWDGGTLLGAAPLTQSGLAGLAAAAPAAWGQASLDVASLAAGPHALTAVFLGSEAFRPSASVEVVQQVEADQAVVQLNYTVVPPSGASGGHRLVVFTVLVHPAGSPDFSVSEGTASIYQTNGRLVATRAVTGGRAAFGRYLCQAFQKSFHVVYDGTANLAGARSNAVRVALARATPRSRPASPIHVPGATSRATVARAFHMSRAAFLRGAGGL